MTKNISKHTKITVAVSMAALVLTGCSFTTAPTKKLSSKEIVQQDINYDKSLLKYKQSVDYLLKDIKLAKMQPNLEEFDKKFYKPWNMTKIELPLEKASKQNAKRSRPLYYGENLRPHDVEVTKKTIVSITNFENYNKDIHYGIVTKEAQVRNLPSIKPFFWNPKEAGEGYPFDYLDESSEHPNTPVIISHYSSDKAWAFVKTPTSTAWMKADSIAVLNKNQMQDFKSSKKIVLTKDNMPIYSTSGTYMGHAKLGSLFPLVNEDNNFFYSYMFKNGVDGKTKKVDIKIAKNISNKFPIEFNKQNIEKIATQLLGEKYGWGGFSYNRDCTAMTKDYFRVFGFWVPRNSGQQADADNVIDIEKMTAQNKEKTIIEKGIPFVSSLYKKGHIMLYVGHIDNKAIIMHDTWGVKTEKDGVKGRIIIGKTIISDLYLGKGEDGVHEKSLLINNLKKLILEPLYTKYQN